MLKIPFWFLLCSYLGHLLIGRRHHASREQSQLVKQGQIIAHGPMFSDFSVLATEHVHLQLLAELSALRKGKAIEGACLHAAEGQTHSHPVTFGKHLFKRKVRLV